MSIQARFEYVLEYVPNLEAAKQFYTDVLGLKVERYHPTFVQFQHFAIASDESLSGNRSPEQYWVVDNAEQAFQELSGKAEILMPLTQKPFGKVFSIKDPSGQPLYLLEYSRNRPSQSVS